MIRGTHGSTTSCSDSVTQQGTAPGCPFCGFRRAYRTLPKTFRSRFSESWNEQRSFRCCGCGRVYQTAATGMRRATSEIGRWTRSARLAVNESGFAGVRESRSRAVPASHDVDVHDLWSALEGLDWPPLSHALDPAMLEFEVQDMPANGTNPFDDFLEDLTIPSGREWLMRFDMMPSR